MARWRERPRVIVFWCFRHIGIVIRILPGAFGLELCQVNRNQATLQFDQDHRFSNWFYEHVRLTPIYMFAMMLALKSDFAAAG